MPATDVSFGQADGQVASMAVPGNLVQYEHDKYRVDFPDKSAKVDGSAPGWMNVESAGAQVTVGMCDFWQKFPNELSADKDGFTVHLWPAHNEDVKEPEITYEKLPLLWFAHHGKVMDLGVPERYWSFRDDEHKESSLISLRPSRTASAAGVARSFEIYLSFRKSGSGPDAYVTSVSKHRPWCVVAPEYACNTLVYGHIAAQRKDMFADIDRALERVFDREMRCLKGLKDYGKWIYGNAHTNYGHNGYENRYYAVVTRVWRNTHHSGPRAPWILYAHFGRMKYLDWAIANAENMLDIVYCHERVPGIPVLHPSAPKTIMFEDVKFKGGICDYKGYVPWNSGMRNAYNSMADFMLFYYYNAGNRWGLEVMREVADYYKKAVEIPDLSSRTAGGRASSARVSTSVNIYRATGDEFFLKCAEAHLTKIKNTQLVDGNFTMRVAFAPGLVNFYDLTGSPVCRDMIVKEMDFIWNFNKLDEIGFLRGKEIAGQYFMRSGYHLDNLACAYRITGDERYLQLAKGRLLAYASSVTSDKGPDAHFSGLSSIFSGSYSSYFLAQAPHAMRQLIVGDRDNTIKPRYPEWRYLGGPDMKIIFKKEFGEPVSFFLHYHNTKPKGAVVFSRLEPLKGDMARSRPIQLAFNVCKRPHKIYNFDINYKNMVQIDIPGGWAGECLIEFAGVSDDFFIWVPLRMKGKAEVKMVYSIPDMEKGYMPTPINSLYFGVTEPKPEIEIVRKRGYACLAGPFVFLKPNGEFIRTRVTDAPAPASRRMIMADEPLEVRSLVCLLSGAQYTQQTRELEKDPARTLRVGKMKGLTRFFSATEDQFFVPEKYEFDGPSVEKK